MHIQHWLVLLGSVAAIGCATSAVTSPTTVDGMWTGDFTVPGNSVLFTLATQGSAITGDGHWTGEACCAGPVTVTGTVAGNVITLDLGFTSTSGGAVPPYTEHFEGHLVGANQLSGILTFGGQSAPYGYHRIMPD
jgi:hypothetical protein